MHTLTAASQDNPPGEVLTSGGARLSDGAAGNGCQQMDSFLGGLIEWEHAPCPQPHSTW
jgi:hypothetical protein